MPWTSSGERFKKLKWSMNFHAVTHISMQSVRMRAMLVSLLPIIVGWKEAGGYDIKGYADDKIVGGSKVVDIRNTPYVVSLQRHGYRVCGGSIVTLLWVVTACHCVAAFDRETKVIYSKVRDVPLPKWKFLSGTVHLIKTDSTVQYRRPASVLYHPQCTLSGHPFLYNDIALANMTRPFTLNAFVHPVSLFSLDKREFDSRLKHFLRESSPDHQSPDCRVAGWGMTVKQSLAAKLWRTTPSATPKPEPVGDRNQLKSSTRFIMDDKKCLVMMLEAVVSEAPGYLDRPSRKRGFENSLRKFLSKQICSLSKFKNESSCRGDSGSGLVCNGFLVGVVSSSYACSSDPDVYQNLVPLFDWFKSTICQITCEEREHLHPQCSIQRGFEDFCNRPNATRSSRLLNAAHWNTIPVWLALSSFPIKYFTR